jgi:16S rRNA (adenine1518-N6/adenine1519-N6)-dimethyltransferase
MLRGALAGLAGSPALASERLAAAGVDPETRGEMLTVHDFARIAEQMPRQ